MEEEDSRRFTTQGKLKKQTLWRFGQTAQLTRLTARQKWSDSVGILVSTGLSTTLTSSHTLMFT